MAHIIQNPTGEAAQAGPFHAQNTGSSIMNGSSITVSTPPSASSSNNTYLLPTSPMKGRRASNENYKPRILRTCGARPACLVNASVTYCNDNQLYAFGGFDQYTDEGTIQPLIGPTAD